jgi:hypothetical protein
MVRMAPACFGAVAAAGELLLSVFADGLEQAISHRVAALLGQHKRLIDQSAEDIQLTLDTASGFEGFECPAACKHREASEQAAFGFG